jgi:uncharacterized protein with PQ loop repeat
MPKKAHPKPKDPLQKRVINRIIFPVAALQPLGTIPQIIRLYTHHNAVSISISSWLIFVLFDLLWLWYGIDNKQNAVIVSAILFTLLEGIVLVGGLLYGGSW